MAALLGDNSMSGDIWGILASGFPPPFVYVHDPGTVRATGARVRAMLNTLSSSTASTPATTSPNSSTRFHRAPDNVPNPHVPDTCFLTAHLSAVSAFTPRLLFDSALNGLAKHTPSWDDACTNYAQSAGLDGFIHGIQALYQSHLRTPTPDAIPIPSRSKSNNKGKAKAKALQSLEGDMGFNSSAELKRKVHLVIAIERAERLAPDLLIPLSRLSELSRTPLTLLLISSSPYAPPPGSTGTAALNPYHVVVKPPSKEATLTVMAAHFPDTPSTASTSAARVRRANGHDNAHASPSSLKKLKRSSARPASSRKDVIDTDLHDEPLPTYHPSLRPLYIHFTTALYSVCAPFVRDPHELTYIAAGRWPGFAQPVIDHFLSRSNSQEAGEEERQPFALTDEERLRLLRRFMPSFSAALDSLYPRLTHAKAWARENATDLRMEVGSDPTAPLKDKGKARTDASPTKAAGELSGLGLDQHGKYGVLPTMSKYILLASFLASSNPAKTDVRMFARGRDTKARRKKGGGTAKARAGSKSGLAKVPQRLLGPAPFPQDRMLAILAILLEEYDLDKRIIGDEFTLSGEYTEMEVGRVWVSAAVNELASMRLLQRTTPLEKIDSPPAYRCALPYEDALALGRELKVPMLDLMWEAV